MNVGTGAGSPNVRFQEADLMTRFIALTLLASMTLLSFVDTAEARRCRRRSSCNSCQTACASNGCQPGAMQDPGMMPPGGQPTYANPPAAPTQPPAPRPQPNNAANFNGNVDAELTN
ncbi:MAG: hypothetical protein C0483_01385 [Pirellula sp.]|nr:hypothetical protein [Pirellula sp.]